jgi:hypothetical protein
MRYLAGLFLAIFCVFGSTARVAAADASVVVLGLRSLEGDDDFANAMTDALRAAAKGVGGWRLIERSVSMAQMTLAHSCDDVDAACLNEIAKGLESDRVIFGTVRRTAARGKYDYEITVSVFNATTHTIVDTQTDVVAKADSKTKKNLSTHGQTLVGKLAASDANAGRLMISVNVSVAEVSLDGKSVGRTQDGKIVLENLSAGDHTLEVSAGGHQLHTQRFSVSPAEQNSIDINLEPFAETPVEVPPDAVAVVEPSDDTGGGSLRWLGYTLIGVGAASAIAWGASMYLIEFEYNRDARYQAYVNSYGNRSLDTCDEALNGNPGRLQPSEFSEFQGQCRTARTFQALQWVFLGAAVVAAGAGTYVLLNESNSPETAQARNKQKPRLAFTPTVDRRSIALQATLRF